MGIAENHVPTTPAVLHVLLALADRARHGLGISDDIETRTDGAVILGPGTLYGTIKRMLRSGLIEETSARPDPNEDDPRRRYYQLSRLGREVLSLEIERMRSVVAIADEKRTA